MAYGATATAPVVAHLLTAGAILVGKTNLDQFATGLVGVRSPYRVSRNPFDEGYIPGGSSSGSSVAVSSGLVSFSLGTDTAGSGRVPAAFNNIVGLKPTRGRLSTRNVVPACRSLDCVSIFALCGADALRVFRVVAVFDERDAYARDDVERIRPSLPAEPSALRVGIPAEKDLAFFGNTAAEALFEAAVARASMLGATIVGVDFAPFLEAARLLYEGPWVAERYVAIRDFIETQPDALYPVTRDIIGGGGTPLAADAFAAAYRLEDLKRRTAPVWDEVDVLLTPTAGTIYTVAEVEADPVQLNSNLGYYTNYMNLLDLSAIAVPAGFQPDGLPFGVTLVAPPFQDEPLCRLGDAFHRVAEVPLGAGENTLADWPPELDDVSNGCVRLCMVGAHMSGLPLNHH